MRSSDEHVFFVKNNNIRITTFPHASTDFFYNVILSWALYFFCASFTTKLPFSSCDNEWNTIWCLAAGESLPNNTDEWLSRSEKAFALYENGSLREQFNESKFRSSAEEYFL